MIYNTNLLGDFSILRHVHPEDAEFILSLRLNPETSKFLHSTDPSIEKQKSWIKEQQLRQGDYYFIIEDKAGVSFGTVGLYNIDAGKRAEFGRWICVNSAVIAIESFMLVHDFGFEALGLEKIFSRIVVENNRVISAHERFGYRKIKEISSESLPGQILLELEVEKERYAQKRKTGRELLKQRLGKN
ncbi:MAG: GNAT family N-acetyltransferase [Candidatus Omnitrophica bacterium]|nr:GNAT family N-acetyltransferase [Candidatus Omnitrophota bacterium]